MVEYILDCLAEQNASPRNDQECEQMNAGIRLFLTEHGIRENEVRAYHRSYVSRVLRTIAPEDLRAYFLSYPAISEVRQILLECASAGRITNAAKARLYRAMSALYTCGLGEKYVPAAELRQIELAAEDQAP